MMSTTITATPATATDAGTTTSPDPGMAGIHQPDTEIHGFCSEAFAGVRAAFEHSIASAQEVGASVAVLVDGHVAVDLWGGYFDDTFTRPWGRHTITNGFSSTKTITALCALVLADRGELDLDAPVAEYWPEFAAAGKADVKVRYLLGHTSGVAGWSEPMTLDGICDVEESTAILARQEPWWEPGTAGGYHGFTQGHLVGEVVRRVTGKPLGTFLTDELTTPLGVATDYYIGTPEEADPEVSLLIPAFPIHPRGNKFFDRVLLNPPATPRDSWTIRWRRAGMGAMNGHGNARGIATLQSVLANGGAGGVQLMSDAGRHRVLEQQAEGMDLVLEIPLRWGMGYCLDPEIVPSASGSRVAWWAGNGGSMSFVDLDHRMSFGYVPNRYITGAHEMDRSLRLLSEVYAALTSDQPPVNP
jgi:CubicO group peptidase (beta-lactamase class C family)